MRLLFQRLSEHKHRIEDTMTSQQIRKQWLPAPGRQRGVQTGTVNQDLQNARL
jgi:hypothetical protein